MQGSNGCPVGSMEFPPGSLWALRARALDPVAAAHLSLENNIELGSASPHWKGVGPR